MRPATGGSAVARLVEHSVKAVGLPPIDRRHMRWQFLWRLHQQGWNLLRIRSAFGYERVAQVRRVLRTFNEAAARRRSEEFLVLPTHAPGEASGDAGLATEHRGSGVREGTR